MVYNFNMKISKPADGIWYFEDAIPDHAKFLSLIDELDTDPAISQIISPWNDWFDGGARENDLSKWDIMGDPKGKDKLVDWDRTYQDLGNTWPKKEMPLTEAHIKAYEIIKLIDEPFKDVIDYYWSQHPSLPKPKYISKNYPIRKYKTGGFMGKHIDINRHTPSMDISILIYLNDDYVGGELEYINDTNNRVKIIPQKKLVVIMNNQLEHRVLPITSGVRYSLAAFFGFMDNQTKSII